MKFLLGCAVWAYKGWIGEFYPPKSQAGELLHLYIDILPGVNAQGFLTTPLF